MLFYYPYNTLHVYYTLLRAVPIHPPEGSAPNMSPPFLCLLPHHNANFQPGPKIGIKVKLDCIIIYISTGSYMSCCQSYHSLVIFKWNIRTEKNLVTFFIHMTNIRHNTIKNLMGPLLRYLLFFVRKL